MAEGKAPVTAPSRVPLSVDATAYPRRTSSASEWPGLQHAREPAIAAVPKAIVLGTIVINGGRSPSNSAVPR